MTSSCSLLHTLLFLRFSEEKRVSISFSGVWIWKMKNITSFFTRHLHHCRFSPELSTGSKLPHMSNWVAFESYYKFLQWSKGARIPRKFHNKFAYKLSNCVCAKMMGEKGGKWYEREGWKIFYDEFFGINFYPPFLHQSHDVALFIIS